MSDEWKGRQAMTEHGKLDEAIVRSLGSYLTSEAEQKITVLYGPEIAAKVRALYDDAMNCPVDWNTETMDSALGILADFLTQNYPWLSAKARSRLNFAYIMNWK